MKITEQNFPTLVKGGAIALVVAVVLNVYLVMRNVELYRDASKAEQQAAQLGQVLQLMQGALQDFAARAQTDPQLAALMRQMQSPPTNAPAAQAGGAR